MRETTGPINSAFEHVRKLEQPEQFEIAPLAYDNFAPNQFESPNVAGILYIKQVRQAGLLDGLSRVFADIYGDRSRTPLTFSDLLHRLGVDSVVVAALARTEGQPVANKLLDRLSHRMALTAEGHKQFQILKLLYGLNGDQPRTAAEIAAQAAMPLKDVKHLFIMMRCRLESHQIKSFIEDTIRSLVGEFIRSPLYSEILAGEHLVPMIEPAGESNQCAYIKDLEMLADSLVANVDQTHTVNISGQAGTGKSSLAMKVAARFLQQGKRVLYVTHSRFFAHHVQSQTRFYPGDLTVSTFHALCHLFAKETGVAIPTYRNNKVFNELFPELLIEAMHRRNENAFDVIIVDEGHAFLPNFWRALKFCLKDIQHGPFFYFYDPLVMNMSKNKATPFAVQTINLSRQIRPNFKLPTLRGGVEAYEAISKEEIGAVISKVVTELVDFNVRPEEIAILASESLPKVHESRCSLPKGVKLAATPGSRAKQILYTSLSSFRAMSKRVVILTLDKEVEDLAEWKLKYLTYSAFSRADEKLILIGNLNCISIVLPTGLKTINPEAFDPQLRRKSNSERG